MISIYPDRESEDLLLLKKICFDTLVQDIKNKPKSDLFCGFYFEGRDREINCLEDFAAIHSFKIYSEYNYPVFIFSPNSNGLLNNKSKYKGCRIEHVKIPICDSHNSFSNFMIKEIWKYFPCNYENLLGLSPDGFLIKNGWEDFVTQSNLKYIGAAWCHRASVQIMKNGEWEDSGFPDSHCGNGGFTFRSRAASEEVSQKYSKLIMRERGSRGQRVPEDLFYSHFINGAFGPNSVADTKQSTIFSLDPITLDEYNNKTSYGFHHPQKVNSFQKYRDYYLSIK